MSLVSELSKMRYTGKRKYVFNLLKIKLEELAVCFMVPLGSNFVQKPDKQDNSLKGGPFNKL